MLNPGNVQLIAAPEKIEVKNLETESAFLATINAPAGTYQSITVNLSNPELTILNQSGGAIGNCAITADGPKVLTLGNASAPGLMAAG